ncbi:MAG: AraC family transcriptional regulator [Lachnospiraceae bacterium]|nr:AraC family transcriptional regulator [Lachnospiraceae bacterium]
MYNLFEPGDLLNSPYEAFLFDTAKHNFPVRSHWHHYMEILLMVEGTALVESDEKSYILAPGDMAVLPPEAIHAIYSKPGCDKQTHLLYYVIKFDLNRFRENIGYVPQLKSAVLQAMENPEVSFCFSSQDLAGFPVMEFVSGCAREAQTKHYGYYMIMYSYINCILVNMLRIWRGRGFTPSYEVSAPSGSSIETITEYIDAHSDQPLKVEQLAIRCNMSYSFFAKQFRQIYGRSCKEYIEYIRVIKTEDMLLFTDYDMTYISQAAGFSDCSHMIKTFRKYKNITPKQFRMQNTKNLRSSSTHP